MNDDTLRSQIAFSKYEIQERMQRAGVMEPVNELNEDFAKKQEPTPTAIPYKTKNGTLFLFPGMN